MTASQSVYGTPTDVSTYKRVSSGSADSLKQAQLVQADAFPKRNTEADFMIQQMPYNDTVKILWYFHNMRDFSQSFSPGIKVTYRQLESEWFQMNSDFWRAVIVPKNRSKTGVGVFIERKVELDTPERSASVSVTVYNSDAYELWSKVEAVYIAEVFDYFCSDWGFHSVLDYSLHAKQISSPLLFEVCLTPAFNAERSREATGYVGLINEGTTCYLNSLLQTLFLIGRFRQAVFSIPVTHERSLSVANSLQQVMRDLESSPSAVSTKVVYEALGWDFNDINTQHDIQEFNLKLCEILEANMKGTAAEGTFHELFEGETVTQIICKDVEYSSERRESFFDIQLDVKDCGNLYKSLDKYTADEHLTGDNQYFTEEHGKQDAVRAVKFSKLPPVLQIQLKRFELSHVTGRSSKINDQFEFYPEVDLAKYTNGLIDAHYLLFSVIVHSGNAQNGHYFACIDPKLDGHWLKFNDASIDHTTSRKAIDSNFGGTVETYNVTHRQLLPEAVENESNAYMLVYIQASRADILGHCKAASAIS